MIEKSEHVTFKNFKYLTRSLVLSNYKPKMDVTCNMFHILKVGNMLFMTCSLVKNNVRCNMFYNRKIFNMF